MRRTTIKRLGLIAGTIAAMFTMAIAPAAAVATRPGVEASRTSAASTSANKTNDAKNQAKLQLIISRGDKEINRRLKTLNTLSVKITKAKKLSSANKTTLNNEVTTEISDLNDLKKKLDADTDLVTAQTDAQSIFSGYRVYALIVPKVQLVKTADDQQVAESRLTDLAAKLQTRINEAQKKGKDVASLQSAFDSMVTKTAAAQTTSSNVETAVINLQPADYNSNHNVLSGQRDKLKSAQENIKAATADAKTIVNGLKKL
jgi:hypothetical protein